MPAKRNESCPCGSGRKFKKCCGGDRARKYKIAGLAFVLLIAVVAGTYFLAGSKTTSVVAIGGLISIGAFVIFRDPPPSHSDGSPSAITFGQ